jgi:hypothetical protein
MPATALKKGTVRVKKVMKKTVMMLMCMLRRRQMFFTQLKLTK